MHHTEYMCMKAFMFFMHHGEMQPRVAWL